MLESEMVEVGVKFLRTQTEFKLVRQEVPFLSRCIDVVLLDQANEVVSIEFKVSKWRHAIDQAKNHKLGADKAYICLPERKLTDILSQAVYEAGIGLLFLETDPPKVYEVIPAPVIHKNIAAFRDMLIKNTLIIEP